MSRLGLALYASSADNLWPAIVALRPSALVVMDANHLPTALGAEPYFCWRPWTPGTMREHTPLQWRDAVYQQWIQRGGHPFHGIMPLNETNLSAESGYPEGSPEAAQATVAWGLEVLDLIRATWPGWELDVHSPPLSPNVPGWQNFYRWLAPLIDACDMLNVHTYLDQLASYREPHQLYPNMPLVISECGDRGNGTAEYGRRLLAWHRGLPDYVEWATAFVYNPTHGLFPEWELAGTAAEKVLIEAQE